MVDTVNHRIVDRADSWVSNAVLAKRRGVTQTQYEISQRMTAEQMALLFDAQIHMLEKQILNLQKEKLSFVNRAATVFTD